MNNSQDSPAQLLASALAKDERLKQLAEKMRQSRAENERIAAPMFDELGTLGFAYTSFYDLAELGSERNEVVPVLLRWLSEIEDPHVKDMLAGRLNVMSMRRLIVPELLRQFRELSEDRYHFAKWRMGDVISGMANDTAFDDIASILKDKSHGTSRQMLALSLGKMKKRAPEAIKLLNSLLEDDDMPGHVMCALRKLNGREARPNVERYLTSKNTWLRNEAKSTIAKFDRPVS